MLYINLGMHPPAFCATSTRSVSVSTLYLADLAADGWDRSNFTMTLL